MFAGSLHLTFPPEGKDARGTFDNHGQINDAVSVQPIHTPSLLIYIYNAVFHLAFSNMAQRHVAFCERHVALRERHVALHVRHAALLIFRR